MARKNSFLLFVLIAVLTAGILAPIVPEAYSQDKPIELTLNLVFPSTHPRWKGFNEWLQKIEAATGNRIKFVPYFASSLAPFQEAYDAAVTGLADMTEAFIPMSPGRFGLGTITEVTPIDKSTDYPSRILWQLYSTSPEFQKEFEEVKVIAIKTFPAYRRTTKKPVKRLEDLKGLKIASDSPWAVEI